MTDHYNQTLVKAFTTVLSVKSGEYVEVTKDELLEAIYEIDQGVQFNKEVYSPLVTALLLQMHGYMIAYGEYAPIPKDTWEILVTTLQEAKPSIVH